MARYPSSLIWYTHCEPFGSFGTARHSMGSLKVAEPRGREFSLRSMSVDVMRKIRTAGDGMAVAYLVEENLSCARCS